MISLSIQVENIKFLMLRSLRQEHISNGMILEDISTLRMISIIIFIILVDLILVLDQTWDLESQIFLI
mgnify:FL=1